MIRSFALVMIPLGYATLDRPAPGQTGPGDDFDDLCGQLPMMTAVNHTVFRRTIYGASVDA
ncbi:hypothetical protein A8M77_12360 [Variovorax sp. JS1663]|nr:hypothetical protein A8M77_12360 [Variovorax sp. JS1663]